MTCAKIGKILINQEVYLMDLFKGITIVRLK